MNHSNSNHYKLLNMYINVMSSAVSTFRHLEILGGYGSLSDARDTRPIPAGVPLASPSRHAPHAPDWSSGRARPSVYSDCRLARIWLVLHALEIARAFEREPQRVVIRPASSQAGTRGGFDDLRIP